MKSRPIVSVKIPDQLIKQLLVLTFDFVLLVTIRLTSGYGLGQPMPD